MFGLLKVFNSVRAPPKSPKISRLVLWAKKNRKWGRKRRFSASLWPKCDGFVTLRRKSSRTVPLRPSFGNIYITSSSRDGEKCTTWMLWASLSVSVCTSASCSCPAHPPASRPRRQTCALTHYSVKSSITRWFVVSSLWVFKVDHYKHCSKCYERKCTLGFSGGFYTRQAEADYYVYRRSSPSSPRRLFWLRRTPLPVSDSECSDMLPPPSPPLFKQPGEPGAAGWL